MRNWVKWSAWLCLSLMLWTAAVETVHTHANRTESVTCSICVVAHSTSPTVGSGHTAPIFAAIGLLRVEDVVAAVHVDLAHAGIRGPPAVL
ncbi:MAG: hypothetical protein ACRD3B_03565 [Candidatus Sulfotelmatobacter sp.]